MDTDNRLVVTRGGGKRGKVDVVKGIKYGVTERNLTMGGEHTMQYICALLLNCTLETYWILLTNVTIIKNKFK